MTGRLKRWMGLGRRAQVRPAPPLAGMELEALPEGTEWRWRPDLWRLALTPAARTSVASASELGAGAVLFHDCPLGDVNIRQLPQGTHYGLRLDVLRFEGSFLSLVLELPEQGVSDLHREHLLQVSAKVTLESPLEIFVRLNIKHGPNVEQIVRELPVQEGRAWAEFDLFYANLEGKRLEKAWVDLIFERPQCNQIDLEDLTLSRALRAVL